MPSNPTLRVFMGIRLSSGAESISAIPATPGPGYPLFANGIPYSLQLRAFLPSTLPISAQTVGPIALPNLLAGQTQLQPLVNSNYSRLG